jgi:hypothetical protein
MARVGTLIRGNDSLSGFPIPPSLFCIPSRPCRSSESGKMHVRGVAFVVDHMGATVVCSVGEGEIRAVDRLVNG